MATKRVCVFVLFFPFLEDFSFRSERRGDKGFQPTTKRSQNCLNTTRTTHQKSRSTLPLRLPPHHFFFICEIFVVQSATVEIPAEKKRDGSPPFFGRFYPTCDARNGGRELLLWVAFCGMPSTAAQPTKKKRERIFRRMTLMTQNWKPRCPSRNM